MNKISFFILLTLLYFGCSGKDTGSIYGDPQMKNISAEMFTLGKKVYSRSCFTCHTYGLSGAAKLVDFDYWNRVADKGIDTIFTHVKEGYNGNRGIMPPRGNCFNCSDEELRASILYIFQKINSNKDGTKYL